MKYVPRFTAALILSGICVIELGFLACGHKSSLHPPPPRRLASVENLTATTDCGSINLSWQEIPFDNRGEPLDSPPRYIVLRRRGERIPDITPTPSASPMPEESSDSRQISTRSDHLSALIAKEAPESEEKPPTEEPNTAVKSTQPTPTTSPTPTPGIYPEFEYRIIAVLPAKPWESDTVIEPREITFSDNGLPGAIFPPAVKFRLPRGFPPEKDPDSPDPAPGYSYFYQIQAVGNDNVTSEASSPIQIDYVIIPDAPENLTLKFTESTIELSWSEPFNDCRGEDLTEPVSGYFVERSQLPELENFTTIATIEADSEPSYTDESYEYDTRYSYRIRAFVGDKISGRPSTAMTVDTRDTFPPDTPVNVKIAYSQAGVYLLWDTCSSKDLLGYHIYRWLPDGEKQKLTLEPITKNRYVDADIQSGQTYVYCVTAVDTSKQINESVESDSVNISVP